MKLAVALVCTGGVGFLLRVLVALLLEAKTSKRTAHFYFARFAPSKQQSELITIPHGEQTGGAPTESGGRMAS